MALEQVVSSLNATGAAATEAAIRPIIRDILDRALSGERLSEADAIALIECSDLELPAILRAAAASGTWPKAATSPTRARSSCRSPISAAIDAATARSARIPAIRRVDHDAHRDRRVVAPRTQARLQRGADVPRRQARSQFPRVSRDAQIARRAEHDRIRRARVRDRPERRVAAPYQRRPDDAATRCGR